MSVFVAKIGKRIVGAIIGIETNKKDVFVADWVVDKAHRGRKIGKALYKRLFKAAGRTPVITLVSTRYRVSLAAHKEMGFKEKRLIKDAYGVGEKENYHLLYMKN